MYTHIFAFLWKWTFLSICRFVFQVSWVRHSLPIPQLLGVSKNIIKVFVNKRKFDSGWPFKGAQVHNYLIRGRCKRKKEHDFFWPLVFFMLHLLNNKTCEKLFRRDGWVDLTKIPPVHLVTDEKGRWVEGRLWNCGSKRWTTLRTRWTRATGPLSPGLGRSLFSWWRMFGPEIPALTNARSCRWRLFTPTGALYTI